MSQFNFGSNLTPTSAPNFSFGSKPTTGFGGLGGAQPTQPAGSITFGTPVATAASTQPSTGFGFGTSSPALGAGLGGFGTPTAAAPSFGTAQKPATTGLTFGTPTTQQQGFGFGTPTSSTGGLAFGSTPAPSTGLTFGAAAAATTPSTGLAFGAATSTPATGLTFGSTAPAPSTGLAFGAATTAASTGLNFGAPAATSAFTLGTPSTTTQTTSLFGTPATTAAQSGLGLGGTLAFPAPATSAPAFGTSTPSTGLQFGATQPASTGLSFGLGGTTTAAGLSFKPASTTGTSVGLNFTFPSSATTTAPTSTQPIGLGGVPATATTATSQSVGLGGVDASTTRIGTVTTGQTSAVSLKDTSVPPELIQLIENFKTFVKDQKVLSSDISRGSAKPFLKVGEDIDLFNSVLSEVGNELNKNHQLAIKLKHDSAKSLQNAEMAQRTNDTPPGLQYENTAPVQYFIDLVNGFEHDLQALRLQIENTDKHIQSLREPKFLTSQELSIGMRKLHDTFVALAGRLQTVHSQVESQKEQYLNLRKYILKDPTDIFAKPPTKEKQALENAIKGATTNHNTVVAPGPSPFASIGSPFGMNILAQQQAASNPPPAYPATTNNLSFGSGTANATLGQTGVHLLGTPSNLGQTGETSGFQLQNPPLGNKRGKR